MPMQRIKELEALASSLVGDGKAPNLYFVSKEGTCVMVTRDADAAHRCWLNMPRNIESALEDRKTGVISSTEPIDDKPGARLVTHDDFAQFTRRAHA